MICRLNRSEIICLVPVDENGVEQQGGEKLYVTADKRSKGGNRRQLCWTVGILLLLAAILIAVLAATGVISTSTATPVNQYNSSLSSARALGGLGATFVHSSDREPSSDREHAREPDDGTLEFNIGGDVPEDSLYVPRTVEGRLKIDNEEFTRELADEFSELHREFTSTLAHALARALFPPDGNSAENYIRVGVVNLAPGSVVVTYRIHWIPKPDVLNAADPITYENVDKKLLDYLQRNHRMLNIYHVSEEDMETKRVLDRCQNDKNGCEYGCDFDDVMLDFKCICPSDKVPDMKNPKKCVHPMDNSLYAHHPATTEDTNEEDYKVLNVGEGNMQPPNGPHERPGTDIVIDSSEIFDWMNSRTAKTEPTTENMLDIENSHVFGNPKNYLLIDPITKMPVDQSSEPSAEPKPTGEPSTKHSPVAVPTAEPEPKTSAEVSATPEPFTEPTAEPELEPTYSLHDDIDENVTSLAESIFQYKSIPTGEPQQEPTSQQHPKQTKEPQAEPQPLPEPQPQPESSSEPHAEPELEPEPTSEPEPKPTSEPEAEPQPQPEPSSKPQADPEPKPEPTSEPEATLKSGLTGEPQTESKALQSKVKINIYDLDAAIEESLAEENNKANAPPVTHVMSDSKSIPKATFMENSEKITKFNNETKTDTNHMSKTNYELQSYNKAEDKTNDTSSIMVRDTIEIQTEPSTISFGLSRSDATVDGHKEITFISSENTTDETNYREYMGEDYEIEDVTTKTDSEKKLYYNVTVSGNVQEEITEPTTTEENKVNRIENVSDQTNLQPIENIATSTKPTVRSLEQNRNGSTLSEEDEEDKTDGPMITDKPYGEEPSFDINNQSNTSSETMIGEKLDKRSDSTEITFDTIKEVINLTVEPDSKVIESTTIESNNEATTSNAFMSSETNAPNLEPVNSLEEMEITTTEHSDTDWLSSVIDQENETLESTTYFHVLDKDEAQSTDKPEDNYEIKKAHNIHSENKEIDDNTDTNEDDENTDTDYLSNARAESQDGTQYGLLTDYDSASYRDKRLQATSPKPFNKPNITDKMLADYIYNSANRSLDSAESEELELNKSNGMTEEQEMDMQTDISGKEPAPVWEHGEIEPEQVFYNEGGSGAEAETVVENKPMSNQHNDIMRFPIVTASNDSHSNNLNLTVYEVPSNTTTTFKVESDIHSAEPEEHESEMNPFLPEIGNNKYLVKKLQEGHDLELSNVSETQNEHSDEILTVEIPSSKPNMQIQNVTKAPLKSDDDISVTTEADVKMQTNRMERSKHNKNEETISESSDELDKIIKEQDQLLSSISTVAESNTTKNGSSRLIDSSFINDISDLLSSKEGSGTDETSMLSMMSSTDNDVQFMDMLSTTTQPFSNKNELLETELRTNAPLEEQHFNEHNFPTNDDDVLSVLPIKGTKKLEKKPTNDYLQKNNEKSAKLQENNLNDISDYSDSNQRTLELTNYQSE